MGLLRAVIVIWILCSFFSPVLAKKKYKAQPIRGTQSLSAELNRTLNGIPSKTSVGIMIKSMKMGDTLYKRNDTRTFVPASILKVLTAEAALIYLGPDFRFQTKLLTDAKNIHAGVIDGNIYLVHSGDPTLTYKDFQDLMSTLKNQQVTKINGNVYIDNTAYDQDNFGPGWIWKDKRFCFAAPINASIINHNCVSFKILPGKSAGQLAEVVTSPKYFYAGINNQVTTRKRGKKFCSIHLGSGEDNLITISGCIPTGNIERGATSVINDVMQYNQALLGTLFRLYGIQITGRITQGKATEKTSLIATHQSEPLSVLVKDMLKKSDNVIAGSLFKKLGELYTNQPGSWKNGGTAVAQILGRKANVNIKNMIVIDGSGLSRFNQVTPAQVLQALDYTYHNHETSYPFIAALPIAGVDGTLKKRLYNVSGRVHAKTGTMSGVVSLAGYVVSADKEPIAFVIIFNGKNGMGWAYRSLEDKIVTLLAKFSR